MKKIFVIIVLVSVVCLLWLMFRFEEANIERNIIGYIPADQSPKEEFILQHDNFYVPSIHILVITNQGDSVQARIYPCQGPYILQYKGKHPDTIDKKLFVNCQKRRNGIYSIVNASLDSLQIQ